MDYFKRNLGIFCRNNSYYSNGDNNLGSLKVGLTSLSLLVIRHQKPQLPQLGIPYGLLVPILFYLRSYRLKLELYIHDARLLSANGFHCTYKHQVFV
jgi:hypothetical protein